MNEILNFIESYGLLIGGLATTVAFIWLVCQFFNIKRKEYQAKEFETFYYLIKQLVDPDRSNAETFVDEQAAVVFELRRFKRFFPFTLRTLKGLRGKWSKSESRYPRLVEELDLAIEYIEKKT